jgi:hypothetical protein
MAAELLDPVGMQGAPQETLAALKIAVRGMDLERAIVTLVADWQDRRASARYAVMLRENGRTVLSEDAFGGRYGALGVTGLAQLVDWLTEAGASDFKESIVAPHEFNRLLEHLDAHGVQKLIANANPTDPEIYR